MCRCRRSARDSHGREERLGRELTVDVLLDAGEVNGLDTANLLVLEGGSRTSGDGSSNQATGSSEGALLDAGRGNLTGQWAAQGLGEAS